MNPSRSMPLLVLLAAAMTLALGCGRDKLQDRCGSDDDCREGRICLLGSCVAEDVCDDGACECSTDDECPEGWTCDEGTCAVESNNGVVNNGVDPECFENDEGICTQEICGADGGDCTAVPCDLGCPPDRAQRGCECVVLTCEDDEDCDGDLYCFDSACVECFVDPHCPDDQICENEKCTSNFDCRDDADCAPDERCAPDNTCRPRPGCLFDDDCRDGQACLNGRCTLSPECDADGDCPDGYECVGGNCFIELCRGAEDCAEGEVCDAGECIAEPTVVRCEVATPSQQIVEGQRVPLEAFAYDGAGRGIAARFQWTLSNPPAASLASGPAALGGADAGSSTANASAIVGTDAPVPCEGEALFTNPGPVAPDTVRVTVVDAETGGPVSMATVRIGQATQVTNAGGIAEVADPLTGTFDVDVFHDGYNWLTVQMIGARDVRLSLNRASGTGDIAGFTGQFDTTGLHSSGDITLGLAGASLAGGLLELSLNRLLGDFFVSELNVPGIVEEDIPLPGGIVAYGSALGFDVDLKETYYAQSAGGPRIGWGLAGLVPLADLFDFFMGGGGMGGGSVIAQLLPLFNRFDHGAQPLLLTETPYVVDSADIDRDGNTTELIADYDGFPTVDLRPAVRQNLATEVGISNFPILDGSRTEVSVLVGGVVLPSPGFVPLGISATADDDGDGRPDLRRLSIAPPYGSLVGGRFAIVAITIGDTAGAGVGPNGIQLPDEFSVALWNGQSFPAALSLGTFPDGSQTSVDVNSRRVSVTSSAGPVFRVRLRSDDRSWDVWSAGPAGVAGQFGHTVTIPRVPAGQQDIFISSDIFVDAIQTNVNLDDLVGSSGLGITSAGLVSTAYNRTRAR